MRRNVRRLNREVGHLNPGSKALPMQQKTLPALKAPPVIVSATVSSIGTIVTPPSTTTTADTSVSTSSVLPKPLVVVKPSSGVLADTVKPMGPTITLTTASKLSTANGLPGHSLTRVEGTGNSVNFLGIKPVTASVPTSTINLTVAHTLSEMSLSANAHINGVVHIAGSGSGTCNGMTIKKKSKGVVRKAANLSGMTCVYLSLITALKRLTSSFLVS